MADTIMTQEQDYLDLADRVEAAKGPDRDIDGWIYCAMNPDETTVVDHEPGRFPRKAIIGPIAVIMDRIGGKDGAEYLCAPAYTASIDAAVTVVPDGWTWSIPGFVKPWWDCQIVRLADGRVSQPIPQPCETPPLAILAAALRAHASRVGDGRGE